MASSGLYHTIRQFYNGDKDLPPISTATAVLLLIFYAFLYVAPFYLSSTTRPSPHLSRDAPAVIRGRISAVTVTCIICSVFTFALLVSIGHAGPLRALHYMGYFPPGLTETAKCMALTGLLFLGSLFETGIAEGEWRDWLRLRGFLAFFSTWVGYRNIIAGPVTEEVLFRSASVPLFLLSGASPNTIIFGTPIIFGLAHVHHFYEFRLTHPHTPVSAALMRSIFQLAYTTLFGAYATFLYLRNGSLLSVVFVHAFCNWMGLPRFWGRVGPTERPVRPYTTNTDSRKRVKDNGPTVNSHVESGRSSIGWTVVYYVLLVAGVFGFWHQFWALTDSASAMVKFF